MITYRPASRDDVLYVATNVRQKDYEEIMALLRCETHQDFVEYCIDRYADVGCAYCHLYNDEPVCISSWAQVRPNVWSCGMFATDKFKLVGKSLTKFIFNGILPGLMNAGCHRVECQSIVGYDEVHKWLEYIGFINEGVLRKYGKNGEDFVQFGWTPDDPTRRVLRGCRAPAKPQTDLEHV